MEATIEEQIITPLSTKGPRAAMVDTLISARSAWACAGVTSRVVIFTNVRAA